MMADIGCVTYNILHCLLRFTYYWLIFALNCPDHVVIWDVIIYSSLIIDFWHTYIWNKIWENVRSSSSSSSASILSHVGNFFFKNSEVGPRLSSVRNCTAWSGLTVVIAMYTFFVPHMPGSLAAAAGLSYLKCHRGTQLPLNSACYRCDISVFCGVCGDGRL